MLSKTFCVYPWINIHTNTDGRAKLCCNIYTEDYVQKDNKPLVLGSTEFDEFWNGDYMKSVREGMLNGEEIDACQICYDREKIGMESSRVWANENILDDELKKRIESETIHGEFSYNPTHLELRLGNKCNLKWTLTIIYLNGDNILRTSFIIYYMCYKDCKKYNKK